MPTKTKAYDDFLLRYNDLNPEEWIVGPNNTAIRKDWSPIQSQPATNGAPDVGQQLETQHKESARLQALAAGAAENVVPTATGALAAGLASKALGKVAPRLPGWAKVAGAIAPAFISAMGARAIQDKVAEPLAPELYARARELEQQHPYTYMGGSALSGLPVFEASGSLKNIVGTLKALKPSASGATMAQKAAAANVGVGGAIGAGLETGQQLYQGGIENLDPLAILESAAINAVLNEPRHWTSKFGLTRSSDALAAEAPYEYQNIIDRAREAQTRRGDYISPDAETVAAKVSKPKVEAVESKVTKPKPVKIGSDPKLLSLEDVDAAVDLIYRTPNHLKPRLAEIIDAEASSKALAGDIDSAFKKYSSTEGAEHEAARARLDSLLERQNIPTQSEESLTAPDIKKTVDVNLRPAKPVKNPVAEPTAKTPVAEPKPVAKTPVAKTPVAKTPVAEPLDVEFKSKSDIPEQLPIKNQAKTTLADVVGRDAEWEGFKGKLSLDEAGRPVLESGNSLVELPYTADFEVGETNIKVGEGAIKPVERQAAKSPAYTPEYGALKIIAAVHYVATAKKPTAASTKASALEIAKLAKTHLYNIIENYRKIGNLAEARKYQTSLSDIIAWESRTTGRNVRMQQAERNPNAIREQTPDAMDVPASSKISQGLGKENLRPSEPASPKAEEKTLKDLTSKQKSFVTGIHSIIAGKTSVDIKNPKTLEAVPKIKTILQSGLEWAKSTGNKKASESYSAKLKDIENFEKGVTIDESAAASAAEIVEAPKKVPYKSTVHGVESLDASRTEALTEAGLRPKKEFIKTLRDFAKFKRGTETVVKPELVNEEGKALSGRTTVRDYDPATGRYKAEDVPQAELSAKDALADTPIHEYMHPYLESLLNSPSNKDKAFAEKMLKQLSASKEFQDYTKAKGRSYSGEPFTRNNKGNVRIDPVLEEFVVQRGGEDALRRTMNPNKTEFKDFWNYIKSRIGSVTDDQLLKIFSRKFFEDPKHAETFRLDSTGSGARAIDRTQEAEDLSNFELPSVDESYLAGSPENFEVPTTEGTERTIFSHLTRTVLDRLRERGTSGKILADSFKDYRDVFTHLSGRYINESGDIVSKLFNNPFDHITQDNDSTRRVLKSLYDESESMAENNSGLSDAEIKVKEELRGLLEKVADDYIEDGPNVMYFNEQLNRLESRTREKIPFFFPHVVKDAVIDTVRRGDAEAAKLKQEFIDWKVDHGMTVAQAKDELKTLLGEGARSGKLRLDFAGSRKPHGSGLPESWRETSLAKALDYYMKRSASDLAFYRTIEKNPLARGVLELRGDGKDPYMPYDTITPSGEELTPLGSSDEVRFIMRQITGDYPVRDAAIDSVNRVVKSMMMQTMTGARDFAAAPFISLELLNFSELPLVIKAYGEMKKGIEIGKREGVIRNLTSSWEDMKTSYKTAIPDNLANSINKITGREAFERWSRGYSVALGKLVAESRLLAGDKAFFKRFGPKDNSKMSASEITDWAAARFAEQVQGTYDFTGQPAWTLEGKLSPFMSLAKWSIERFNNFDRNVLAQARQGNIKPLLMSTVGAMIGGTIIDELTNYLNAKKPEHLSWTEWLQLRDDNAYRWAAIASASGYAGILGDLTKSLQDVYYNADARTFTFPLVNALGQGVKRLGQASEALQEGEKATEVIPLFFASLARDNIQLARTIINNFFVDAERRGMFRDLRVYERVYEGKVPGTRQESNPLKGLAYRDYKQLGYDEAEKLADSYSKALNAAMDRAMENGSLNPNKLAKELANLRRNQYRTMPSPEGGFDRTPPPEFFGYLNFLTKTQGEDAARQRLLDFYMQREFNRVKSSAVPSI